MAIFLWICFGMAIGFTIGSLAPKRDDDFVTGVQKHLKDGQMLTVSVSQYKLDDDDDDDDGDNENPCYPLMPSDAFRFNCN